MLNFEKYIINENVQKSKKVLKDLNIPETNPNYLALKKLLSRNIGYLGKFTDWHFNGKYSIQRLQDLYKKIKESNLNKGIDEFKTPEDIIDFIIDKNKNSRENKIEKSIPKSIKNFLIYGNSEHDNVEDDEEGIYKSDIEYFGKFIKDISVKVPDNKLDMVCDYFRNKSARCLYQDEPYEYLDDVIDTIVNINPDDIYKNIRNDNKKNLTILIDNDEYLFFICHNYGACKKYGSKFWCIVEDESTFEDYTEKAVQSIFFFKDKIPFIDKESVLGMTINIYDYKISAAHWEDDESCNLRDYEDDLYYSNPSSRKSFYDTILNTITENKSIISSIYSISFEHQLENDPGKLSYFVQISDNKEIFDFIKRKTFKSILLDYQIEYLTTSDIEKILDILLENDYDMSEVFDNEWVEFILDYLTLNYLIKNAGKLISKEYVLENISELIGMYHDDSEFSAKFILLCSILNIDLMPHYEGYESGSSFHIDMSIIDYIPDEKFMINYKLLIKYYSDDVIELSDEKLKLILIKEPEIFFKNLHLFEMFLKDSNLYNEYKDKIYDKVSKMNRKEITGITSLIISNDLDELYPFVIKNLLPPKIMDKYDITYTKK